MGIFGDMETEIKRFENEKRVGVRNDVLQYIEQYVEHFFKSIRGFTVGRMTWIIKMSTCRIEYSTERNIKKVIKSKFRKLILENDVSHDIDIGSISAKNREIV